MPTASSDRWVLHVDLDEFLAAVEIGCLGEPPVYVDDFSAPVPAEAAIPVERITGPILLTCGWQDQVWDSCPMSEALIDRLDREGHRFDHVLVDYAEAGHVVAIPPGWPVPNNGPADNWGGTRAANDRARADAWEATLDFFRDHVEMTPRSQRVSRWPL